MGRWLERHQDAAPGGIHVDLAIAVSCQQVVNTRKHNRLFAFLLRLIMPAQAGGIQDMIHQFRQG